MKSEQLVLVRKWLGHCLLGGVWLFALLNLFWWVLFALSTLDRMDLTLFLMVVAGFWFWVALFWARIAVYEGYIHAIPLFIWFSLALACAAISYFSVYSCFPSYVPFSVDELFGHLVVFFFMGGGAAVVLACFSFFQLYRRSKEAQA